VKNKLVLCRTRLEEAATHLRELIPAGQESSASKIKIATALGYIEKAIDLLRSDSD